MATITFKGATIHSYGTLPALGTQAPDFILVDNGLSELGLADYDSEYIILNITPSLDTQVCADSARKFNQKIASKDNVTVLNISKDLPFAIDRFCSANEIENVRILSGFRNDTFGKDYGVEFVDLPLKGLYSRAVLVLNKERKVVYTEQVSETIQEPNYAAALAALS